MVVWPLASVYGFEKAVWVVAVSCCLAFGSGLFGLSACLVVLEAGGVAFRVGEGEEVALCCRS